MVLCSASLFAISSLRQSKKSFIFKVLNHEIGKATIPSELRDCLNFKLIIC